MCSYNLLSKNRKLPKLVNRSEEKEKEKKNLEEIPSDPPRRRPGVGPPPAVGWPPFRRPFLLLNKVKVQIGKRMKRKT